MDSQLYDRRAQEEVVDHDSSHRHLLSPGFFFNPSGAHVKVLAVMIRCIVVYKFREKDKVASGVDTIVKMLQ